MQHVQMWSLQHNRVKARLKFLMNKSVCKTVQKLFIFEVKTFQNKVPSAYFFLLIVFERKCQINLVTFYFN